MNEVRVLGDCLVLRFSEREIIWNLPCFPLRNNPTQVWTYEGDEWHGDDVGALLFACGDAWLKIDVRLYPNTSMARIRYSLSGDRFAGVDGEKRIFYGAVQTKADTFTEIQLGQFERVTHCFVPCVNEWHASECRNVVAGPIAIARGESAAHILAYEHGAQQPDHYLEISLESDRMALYSTKGNYFDGQDASAYLAPWIGLGVHKDADETIRRYRAFMLHDISPRSESRKPYIFYNTWHFQEGRKYNLGHSVLHDMNEEYLLADIDRAHELGVEVYVIDTGWYQKTGAWEVNARFFPSGMRRVRERLEAYGMKLGLWFNPIVAAQTSEIFVNNPDFVIAKGGVKSFAGSIWETEESWCMCLDTGYAEWFANRLISLHNELGVSYFKWDAIGQYGCDSPEHQHGGVQNSVEERARSYAYRMGLQMIRVVEMVTAKCPDIIVDFDVTEGGRFMGLGFLSVGKYFLVNNGPYYDNFDIPQFVVRTPDTINVFFYPGPARAQVCRSNIRYDAFIPSILFLTHYIPHGDALSDANNQAAMALGGNGIWGYLDEMTDEGVSRWREYIQKYKRVRLNITNAQARLTGIWGGSPEIIEKLDENGFGCVVFFTHAGGEYTYVTNPLPEQARIIDGCDAYTTRGDRSIELRVTLKPDEACTVFFLPYGEAT